MSGNRVVLDTNVVIFISKLTAAIILATAQEHKTSKKWKIK
jgi:hypothetical protein